MSIVFLTDSILTTVQDLGRAGFRSRGINPGGAMDSKTVRIINSLLGNIENEAVIEIHLPAPKILFEKNAVIALGGEKAQNLKPYFVKAGSVLSFDQKISGNRIYLSVRGGFEIREWLGSRSTNLKAAIGGFRGRKLLKNDKILFKQHETFAFETFDYFVSQDFVQTYSEFPKVRIIKGAEWDFLSEESRKHFLLQPFKVSLNADRMGFRLAGVPLILDEKIELVSSAVSFGTIQILPDGQLIILMADHQTTGGYPRIGHICAADLSPVAQLGANDSLNFGLISIEEAESLALLFEKNLRLLKTAVKFK